MALSVVKRPITLFLPSTAATGTASVTSSGGTANFADTAHGLTTGDYVYISSPSEYAGFWYVSRIDNDNFNIREYATASDVSFAATATVTWYECQLFDSGADSWVAVHNPIIYKLKSDLWPTNSVDTARTVSSYSNDAGYAQLTLSGAHGVTELEFVKVTFTGGETAVYQVLTWYSTTVITINLPYRGGITFVSVQKYYSDYHAKVKIYAGLDTGHPYDDLKPYEELAEIKAIPDSNGVITVNINEIIKSKIDILKNNINGATLPNDITQFCRFYITYAEAYSYSEGGYTLLDYVGTYTDDSANLESYAVNAKMPFKYKYGGMMGAYIYEEWLTPFRTPVLFTTTSRTLGQVSQFFDISHIIPVNLSSRVKRELYRNGTIVLSTNDTISVNGAGIYRYEVDRSEYLEDRIDLTLQIDFGSGFQSVSTTKTIEIDDSCGPADDFVDLSWLNHLGGFDYWRFKALSDYGIDIDKTTEASKNYFTDWPNSWGEDADTIDFETSRKSRQTIVVRAENLSKEQAEDLARIKTSPLVQIVNTRTDRRTVILDKSSFVYVKEGERLYSLTFTLRYTDLLPSQSL